MDGHKLIFLFVLHIAFHQTWILCQKCPNLTLLNGKIRYRNQGKTAQFICNSGHVKFGAGHSACLTTGHWTQKTPYCIGRDCGSIPVIPNLLANYKLNGGIVRFSCQPGFYRSGLGELFCEGTTWSGPMPTCIEGVNTGCDFETPDMCGWSQDDTDNFDWTRHKGRTPTESTGPSVDHTTISADGHFAYMESSSPAKRGHKARLLSPTYRPSDVIGYCLQFFYHMMGPSSPEEVGQLEVFVQPASMSTKMMNMTHLVFHEEGNKGDVWNRVNIALPVMTEPFKIIFQGIRLRSWKSDIAIDDISVARCPQDTTVTTTSKTSTPGTANGSHHTSESPTSTTLNTTSTARKGATTSTSTDPKTTSSLGSVTKTTSRNTGSTSPGGTVDTTSGGRGMTSSGGRGMTSSGGRGMTSSGGRGVTSSGGRRMTSSGGRGMTSSGGRGMTSSGGRGMTSSGGRGMTSSGGRGITSPGGRRMTSSGGRGMTSSGGRRMTSSGGRGITDVASSGNNSTNQISTEMTSNSFTFDVTSETSVTDDVSATSSDGKGINGGAGGPTSDRATKPTQATGDNPGRRQRSNSPANKSLTMSKEIVPIVIGVLAAIVIVAILVAVLIWMKAHKNEKRDEEEMNIIAKSINMK